MITIPRARLSMLSGHRVTEVRRQDGDYVLECLNEDSGLRIFAEVSFRNGARPLFCHLEDLVGGCMWGVDEMIDAYEDDGAGMSGTYVTTIDTDERSVLAIIHSRPGGLHVAIRQEEAA